MSHEFQTDSLESIARRCLSRKDCFGYILATPKTPPDTAVGLDQPVKVLEPESVVRVVGVQVVAEVVEVMNCALTKVKSERIESASCCE